MNRLTRLAPTVAALILIASSSSASRVGAGTVIYGQPLSVGTADLGFGGTYFGSTLGGSGLAAANCTRTTAGAAQGSQPVEWRANGEARLLEPVNVSGGGLRDARAYGRNDAGTVVGSSRKYVPGVTGTFYPAVRWTAQSTAPQVLPTLPAPVGRNAGGTAMAINEAGQAAGTSLKYVGLSARGARVVRWSADGQSLQELGTLGTDETGSSDAYVVDINESGTVLGEIDVYDADHGYRGRRAARWGSDNVARPLTIPLTPAYGYGDSTALEINDAGVAIGSLNYFYPDTDHWGGIRAARWRPDGSFEGLGILSTDVDGVTESEAFGMNESGDAVGFCRVHAPLRPAGPDGTVPSRRRGDRAVIWRAGSTVATPLAAFGVDADGLTSSQAKDINAAGYVVGVARSADGSARVAAMWRPDGQLIDPDALLAAGSGWSLAVAHSITDDGWIGGVGYFDADGAGPGVAVPRAWLMQVAVPEPGAALLGVACSLLPGVRRRDRL